MASQVTEQVAVASGTILDRSTLHSLLLALAGRVADDQLAAMRMCLADGETSEVATLLAGAISVGGLPLGDAEVALVRTLLAEHEMDIGIADRAQRVASLGPVPYRFAGQSGGLRAADPAALPTAPSPETTDALDASAVEAGERVGGLRALWRAFRYSRDGLARRVYVGEADPSADVLELVAEIQHALGEAGERTPRVEVFAEGTELTPYHEAALDAAVLVWAVAEAPMRLARVFDGADPDHGPFFDPDHPRLDGPDAERILAYLRAGEPVLNTPGAMDDVLDVHRPAAVPVGFRSDGRWVWPEAVSYYLERHHLAPDPALAAHTLTASSPPPLSRLARHRALTTLFAPTGTEPVWQSR